MKTNSSVTWAVLTVVTGIIAGTLGVALGSGVDAIDLSFLAPGGL